MNDFERIKCDFENIEFPERFSLSKTTTHNSELEESTTGYIDIRYMEQAGLNTEQAMPSPTRLDHLRMSCEDCPPGIRIFYNEVSEKIEQTDIKTEGYGNVKEIIRLWPCNKSIGEIYKNQNGDQWKNLDEVGKQFAFANHFAMDELDKEKMWYSTMKLLKSSKTVRKNKILMDSDNVQIGIKHWNQVTMAGLKKENGADESLQNPGVSSRKNSSQNSGQHSNQNNTNSSSTNSDYFPYGDYDLEFTSTGKDANGKPIKPGEKDEVIANHNIKIQLFLQNVRLWKWMKKMYYFQGFRYVSDYCLEMACFVAVFREFNLKKRMWKNSHVLIKNGEMKITSPEFNTVNKNDEQTVWSTFLKVLALFMSPQFLSFGEKCLVDPCVYTMSSNGDKKTNHRPLFYEALIATKYDLIRKNSEVFESHDESLYRISAVTDFIGFLDFLRELIDYTPHWLTRRETYKEKEKHRDLFEPVSLIFGRLLGKEKDENYVVSHRVEHQPFELLPVDIRKGTTLLLRFLSDQLFENDGFEMDKFEAKKFSSDTHTQQLISQSRKADQDQIKTVLQTEAGEDIEYCLESISRLEAMIIKSTRKIGVQAGDKIEKHGENILKQMDSARIKIEAKHNKPVTIKDVEKMIEERMERNRSEWEIAEPLRLDDDDEETMTLVQKGDKEKLTNWIRRSEIMKVKQEMVDADLEEETKNYLRFKQENVTAETSQNRSNQRNGSEVNENRIKREYR